MRLVRNGLLILGSDISQSALVLLRNVLLARLLSVEQFGIAATFTILVTLIDATQNEGLNRLVVQAPDADDGHFQNTVHTVKLALGAVSAVILLLVAWPYAWAMGTPHLAWAYLLIALVPLIRGFANLDSFRLQRQHRFGPSIMRQFVPQLVSTLSVWPLYLWLGDFRVVLGTIFVMQVLTLILSHLGAERRFGLARDPAVLRRAAAFGGPLMLNSLLLFFVLNGDRMIVSNRFGHEVLGGFSVAFMMTLLPTMVVANSIQSLMLPRMAHVQGDTPRLQRLYDLTASALAIFSVAFVGGIGLLGAPVMTLVFGDKYAAATPFLVPLAIMQALRVSRATPVIAAMARAETRNPLYANIVRGLAIPVALLVALVTGSIEWMILTGIAGEAVAALASAWLARSRTGLDPRHFLLVTGAATLFSAAVAATQMLDWPVWPVLPALLLVLAAARGLFINYKALLRN